MTKDISRCVLQVHYEKTADKVIAKCTTDEAKIICLAYKKCQTF
jgi:hypothetical protein